MASESTSTATTTITSGEKKDGGLEVAYWKIRGLCAAMRMACEYAEADYTPVLYDAGENGTETFKDSWFKDAKQGIREKNPLANLPYIIDGDLCIVQTNACLRHLGRKFNLMGKDESEAIKVDQCLCQVMDLRNTMVGTFYSPKDSIDKGVDDFLAKKVAPSLTKMENWLVKWKTVYCASDSPTVVDFHLWELIDQLEKFAKCYNKGSPIKDKPSLTKLYSTMKSDGKLSKYFKSDLYKLPCNNPHAGWIGA